MASGGETSDGLDLALDPAAAAASAAAAAGAAAVSVPVPVLEVVLANERAWWRAVFERTRDACLARDASRPSRSCGTLSVLPLLLLLPPPRPLFFSGKGDRFGRTEEEERGREEAGTPTARWERWKLFPPPNWVVDFW